MKQESEQATQDVHKEPYEAPRIEVIEMETEQPILAGSGGSNSPWEPDQW